MKPAPSIAPVIVLWASVAAAGQPMGISVRDGGTRKVVQDGQQAMFRLRGIDAPEVSHLFGTKSRDRLTELAMRERGSIRGDHPDRSGRLLASVEIGGRDGGRQMVADEITRLQRRPCPRGGRAASEGVENGSMAIDRSCAALGVAGD